jgi:hypothetical protein
MRLDVRAIGERQLTVEVQLDGASRLNVATHARPPAATFACVNAWRSLCTAACS